MMNLREYILALEFMESAISYVTGIGGLHEAIKQSIGDLVISRSSVQRWLKEHGIKEPISGSAAGGVGIAYFSGDYVIKVTSDPKEAQAAYHLKNYDSPYMAKIHDVKFIGCIDNNSIEGCPETPAEGDYKKRIFVILEEKLETNIAKKHRVAGQAVYSYLDATDSFISDIDSATERSIIQFLAPKYKKDKDIANIIRQMFTGLKTIQDEKGILSRDPHGGNIGFKNRQPAFFDLGRIKSSHPNTNVGRII